jgi:hypothetical protein
MSGNVAIILIGLWLCYRAIFSIPAGEMSAAEIAVTGIAVAAIALWTRRTDVMSWPGTTNIALGGIVVLLALLDRVRGIDPLASFWIILLVGITVAILALWSILYRPSGVQLAAGSR